MDRCVAHLDMDAFYASVELLRHPELRGLPVIVSGSGPRAVVTTCTYEARTYGVHSAMPTARALRLCPHAQLIRPDFAAYKAASQQVWAIVRDEIETVEQVGLDEGYLDLTGYVAPKASMRRVVARISGETGLFASVGIGPNKLVAKIASDCEKPRGMVMLTREEACARFAASPAKLLPGVGPKTAERLASMGIATVGDLRAADAELLRATFGERQGEWLRSRARFEDAGIVAPVRETKSQSSETTFDYDVADRERLRTVMRELSEDLCKRLEKRDLRGRTIGIKVRLDDWTTVTRARTLEHPTHDLEEVSAIALELLEEYDPARPVRLLGVRVAAFAAAGEEPQLRLEVGA
jgi:DNA polymerase-4